LKRQPELAKCTPESILYCIKYAVQHGLELGGTVGQLHMVAFGNQATPIIGYKGVVALLTRKTLRSVEARVVYDKDEFRCSYVTSGIDFVHTPKLSDDRGPMIGVYARYFDKEGVLIHVEVMTRSEVDKVRKSSKASNSGPWVTWYEEQAKKTVAKRGAKYIPLEPETTMAIAEADEIEFSKNPPIDVTDEAEVETVATKTEEVKNALKSKPKKAAPPPPEPEVVPSEEEPEEVPIDEYVPPPEEEIKPTGVHLADLRERVEEMIAVLPDDEDGEMLIAQWARGTGKPKNWHWKQHSTRGDLEKITALLEEQKLLST